MGRLAGNPRRRRDHDTCKSVYAWRAVRTKLVRDRPQRNRIDLGISDGLISARDDRTLSERIRTIAASNAAQSRTATPNNFRRPQRRGIPGTLARTKPPRERTENCPQERPHRSGEGRLSNSQKRKARADHSRVQMREPADHRNSAVPNGSALIPLRYRRDWVRRIAGKPSTTSSEITSEPACEK